MWVRMWSCAAWLGSLLALPALMPGWSTRRVQNRATAVCTAVATSREVAPASRNCARQPTRTSSLWFAAEYLIRSRPLRSSSMMLMQVALARNSSSLSRTASNRHHSSVRRLRSLRSPPDFLKPSHASLNASMGGADPSTGKEEAPPADWRCRYALTDSWWNVDAAWRLRLAKRRLAPHTDTFMYGPAERSSAALGTDFAAHEQALQPTPHSESGTSTGRAHNHVVRTSAFPSKGVNWNQLRRFRA